MMNVFSFRTLGSGYWVLGIGYWGLFPSPPSGSPVAPLREGLRQHGGNPQDRAGSPVPSP
ncbi:hypothetical protein Nos7524_2836 [Nostoc sp. PCC 7524]|uniref:hypothetical protein n=1 Tax=Nostoc sp. (strain ATCC 29411 / PCC 7524) TaxID=28072 RepID=UPI00029ECF5B|nr:hypothetical protein [Nostoc sp. PCC 7524]AFY48654.1 hypothetical protein Nos7524_2836 [Nostoc sp. PCC 7524]